MANLNKLIDAFRCSILQSSRNFNTLRIFRNCSSESKLPKKLDSSELKKKEEDGLALKRKQREEDGLALKRKQREEEERHLALKREETGAFTPRPWNERKAVRRLVKENSFPRNVRNIIDLQNGLVNIRHNIPATLKGLGHYLMRSFERRNLLRQKYLPKRHATLKSDLAAAHFLVMRGGSVRFVGQKLWIGVREKNITLPGIYIPGWFIEEIQLEGTDLLYEGLINITELKYLKSLSLKNLKNVDDWWLDWISSEYYSNLQHLDLTNCDKITYRGLSCMYRFETLKTLNLEGVPDTPELKLACVMLQDILPELEILGIDLSIPEQIKAVVSNESETSQKAQAV